MLSGVLPATLLAINFARMTDSNLVVVALTGGRDSATFCHRCQMVAILLPFLRKPSALGTLVPPVARKYDEWQPGSPQQRVQEAVLDRYGVMERFFEAVATRARVQRDSASKTFYAVMRRERGLPAAQRDAWLELTPIDPETLDAIEAGRSSRRRRKTDPLT